jgi:hypothetical protein
LLGTLEEDDSGYVNGQRLTPQVMKSLREEFDVNNNFDAMEMEAVEGAGEEGDE